MNIYRYNIYRPGGNNTALVESLVKDRNLKKQINDNIMQVNPDVEQVGFIDFNTLRLEMAGGEFCGNATRSATFRFLNGKPGKLYIKVSGAKNRLKAGIDKKGYVWAQMPISPNTECVKTGGKIAIVEMQGITQVIIPLNRKFKNKNAAKNVAFKTLRGLNLINTSPASGVMFCISASNIIEIEPIVWVRNIQTLFYETACASGTCAVAIVETLKRKSSIINLPIKQPSSENILASVDYKNGKFNNAFITGKIQIIKSGLTVKI